MAGTGLHILLPEIQDPYLRFYKYINFLQSMAERRRLVISPLSRPWDITCNSTVHCQLKCPYCETGNGTLSRDPGLMSLEEYKFYFNRLDKYMFLVRQFGTGESLLNKAFPQLVASLKGKEIFSTLSTNLSLPLKDQYIDDLLNSGMGVIIISLDGATPDSYQQYRRGGDFDLVIENTKKLVKRKKELGLKYPLIEWRFLVFRHNEHEVELARKMAKELGVDLLEFFRGSAPIEGEVSQSNETNFFPAITGPAMDEARAKKNTTLQKILAKDLKIQPKNLLPGYLRHKKCDWLWFGSTWFPNGCISPCCVSNNKEDDIAHMDHENNVTFLSQWLGKNYTEARHLFKKPAKDFDVICNRCPNAGSMDHQFAAPLRGILRNAPDWVLKILCAHPDRFFTEQDYFLLENEIRAINFTREKVNRDYPDIQKMIDSLDRDIGPKWVQPKKVFTDLLNVDIEDRNLFEYLDLRLSQLNDEFRDPIYKRIETTEV